MFTLASRQGGMLWRDLRAAIKTEEMASGHETKRQGERE
jgi:hypothetical protein